MRTATAKVNDTAKITEIDAGECELIGPEKFLIPEGDYEAIYSHYETSPIFIKKNKHGSEGGKVFLWFRIDPYKSSELIDPRQDTRLFISYNASSVQTPTGRNGKFRMTRGKKFVKDYERLVGSTKRRDRISPNNFKGKLIKVHVHTVLQDRKQKAYAEDAHYSVIDELKEILTGDLT